MVYGNKAGVRSRTPHREGERERGRQARSTSSTSEPQDQFIGRDEYMWRLRRRSDPASMNSSQIIIIIIIRPSLCIYKTQKENRCIETNQPPRQAAELLIATRNAKRIETNRIESTRNTGSRQITWQSTESFFYSFLIILFRQNRHLNPRQSLVPKPK